MPNTDPSKPGLLIVEVTDSDLTPAGRLDYYAMMQLMDEEANPEANTLLALRHAPNSYTILTRDKARNWKSVEQGRFSSQQVGGIIKSTGGAWIMPGCYVGFESEVAHIARNAGAPYASVRVSDLLEHKMHIRRFREGLDLANPETVECKNAKDAVSVVGQLNGPVLLKPTAGTFSSRGVRFGDTRLGDIEARSLVRDHYAAYPAEGKGTMAQRAVQGDELGVTTIVERGRVVKLFVDLKTMYTGTEGRFRKELRHFWSSGDKRIEAAFEAISKDLNVMIPALDKLGDLPGTHGLERAVLNFDYIVTRNDPMFRPGKAVMIDGSVRFGAYMDAIAAAIMGVDLCEFTPLLHHWVKTGEGSFDHVRSHRNEPIGAFTSEMLFPQGGWLKSERYWHNGLSHAGSINTTYGSDFVSISDSVYLPPMSSDLDNRRRPALTVIGSDGLSVQREWLEVASKLGTIAHDNGTFGRYTREGYAVAESLAELDRGPTDSIDLVRAL